MRTPSWALVADDLTGACDAAVQFGVARHVYIEASTAAASAEVIALSTDSRDLHAAAVRDAHLLAAQALNKLQPSAIFKKIDSTLRGNVPVEVAVCLEAFGCDVAVITPAFPAMGRTVVNGWLLVDGHRTLQLTAQFPDPRCLCFDASCDGDLDAVVAHGLSLNKRVLWTGSGGLAAALARVFCGVARSGDTARTSACATPVTFCIGSNHQSTLAQETELRKRIGQNTILHIERGETSPEDVRRMMSSTRHALFACGGDTASLVCRSLGVQRIELQGEIVTGLPWGYIVGGSFDGVPIATKSGGFGTPDALLKVAEFFNA